MKYICLIFILFLLNNSGFGTEYQQFDSTSTQPHQDYAIEQPGTITFTVGVKIKGKVEKPQVIIFLPKEKTLYRKHILDHSFSEELWESLPFIPVLE
jgi:hypothetical protein